VWLEGGLGPPPRFLGRCRGEGRVNGGRHESFPFRVP